MISEPALERVDNSALCKLTECSPYSTVQIAYEKDMAELKLFAVIPLDTLVGFDIEQLTNWKTIFRKKFSRTYLLISFMQLSYLSFSSYRCDIKGALLVQKEENIFLNFQI